MADPTQFRDGAHRGRPEVGADAGLPLLSVLSIGGVSLLIGLLLVVKTVSGGANAAPEAVALVPTGSSPSVTTSARTSVPPRASTSPRTSASPTRTAPTPAGSGSPTGPAGGVTSADPSSAPVRLPIVVLNGSSRTGLAAKVATRLRRAGFAVISVGNYRAGQLSASTVFAPAGAEAEAAAVSAALVGSPRVRPAVGSLSRKRITVVVTSGYAG